MFVHIIKSGGSYSEHYFKFNNKVYDWNSSLSSVVFNANLKVDVDMNYRSLHRALIII